MQPGKGGVGETCLKSKWQEGNNHLKVVWVKASQEEGAVYAKALRQEREFSGFKELKRGEKDMSKMGKGKRQGR